jgi:hypothetical protein
MPGPWDKYKDQSENGPWAKYQGAEESEANRALSGTGLSVPETKKPPLPAELSNAPRQSDAPDFIKGMYEAKFGISAPSTIGTAFREPAEQMGRGVAQIANARSGNDVAGGVSGVLRGGLATVSGPESIVPMIAANPVGALTRLGAGLLAQKGVESGAEAIGVPEGYAELAGDVAGGIAATRNGSGLQRKVNIARRVATSPEARAAAVDVAGNVSITSPLKVLAKGIPDAAQRIKPALQRARSEQRAAEHRAGPQPEPAWRQEPQAETGWDWQEKLSAVEP